MADCVSISHARQPSFLAPRATATATKGTVVTSRAAARVTGYPPTINSNSPTRISSGFANWVTGHGHGLNHNQERCQIPTRRNPVHGPRRPRCSTPRCALGVTVQPDTETLLQQGISNLHNSFKVGVLDTSHIVDDLKHSLLLLDLDPATAKLAISFTGPFLSAFGFLFIVRIVMSWYPKLPVGKFPYVIAYAPTEPILFITRKVIPPLGGVDVTPVVWFGLLSFLNEILVGPQGLLVLLSQQV